MAIDMTNSAPPRCPKHNNEPMIISLYYRPGSPMGNGWICLSCRDEREAERKESEQTKKDYASSRWPEGAEI